MENNVTEAGEHGPKSVGFFVTAQDIPRICASTAVFCACLGFGSGISSLGVALPDIAENLDLEETSLGILFSCRGLGVLIGALFSARVLERERVLSTHLMCSFAAFLSGAIIILIGFLTVVRGIRLYDLYIPFIVQGACFGAIDSFSAVAIAEMWGQRSQPWMQMKNMMSGAGAVIAPLLLSATGFPTSFILIALLCFTAVFGIIAERAVSHFFHRGASINRRGGAHLRAEDSQQKPADDEKDDITDGEDEDYPRDCEADADDSYPLLGVGRNVTNRALNTDEEEDLDILQAEEIVTLQHSLDAIDPPELYHTRNWEALTDEVLNHIDYSHLSTKQESEVSNAAKVQSHNGVSTTGTSWLLPHAASKKPAEKQINMDENHRATDFRSADSDGETMEPSSRGPGIVDSNCSRHHHRTLAYAPQKIAEKARKHAHFGVFLLPTHVRIVLVLFVFVQIGLLYSTGGWMSTYVTLSEKMKGEDPLSLSVIHLGTFVSTLFFMSQTIASVISVPISIAYSTTAMMRFYLGVTLLGWFFMLIPLPHSTGFIFSSCLLGAGLSCMYPLAMTIANDYGATMDSRSTVSLVMGSCLGEAIAPIVVGKMMGDYGAEAFPTYIFIAVASLFGAYAFVHFYMRYYLQVQRQQEEAEPAEGEEKPLLTADSAGGKEGDSRDSFSSWISTSPRQVVELVQTILLKNKPVTTMNKSFLPASSTRRVSGSSNYGSIY